MKTSLYRESVIIIIYLFLFFFIYISFEFEVHFFPHKKLWLDVIINSDKKLNQGIMKKSLFQHKPIHVK